MKKYFTLIVFTFLLQNAKTQIISVQYLDIISSTSRITYIGIEYQVKQSNIDFNYISDMMARRSQMYEAGWSVVNNEYIRLRDLSLINKYNNSVLFNHKKSVDIWKQNISEYDFSQDYYVSIVTNYLSWPFSLTSIKNEIFLLKRINKEINEIKIKNPSNYDKSKRYYELSKAIKKIENCSPEELFNLQDEFKLYGEGVIQKEYNSIVTYPTPPNIPKPDHPYTNNEQFKIGAIADAICFFTSFTNSSSRKMLIGIDLGLRKEFKQSAFEYGLFFYPNINNPNNENLEKTWSFNIKYYFNVFKNKMPYSSKLSFGPTFELSNLYRMGVILVYEKQYSERFKLSARYANYFLKAPQSKGVSQFQLGGIFKIHP
jgi:hypothetical protein